MIKLYTFCVFIGRHSHDILVNVLKILISSLDRNVNSYELYIYTNFNFIIENKNIKILKYFDKDENYFDDNWLNLSFNKINVWKHLFDTTGDNFVWIDLDTIISYDISYLNNVDNFFIENGNNLKGKNSLDHDNKLYVDHKRSIQGNMWKLNILLYNKLISTFKKLTTQGIKLRWDLQSLFDYYCYIELQGELDKNGINVYGYNYKPYCVAGLCIWSEIGTKHPELSDLDALYIKNGILRSKYCLNKEIHIVSFTFYSIRKLINNKKFNELFFS